MNRKITTLPKPIEKDYYELKEGDVFVHPSLGQVIFQNMKSKNMSIVQVGSGQGYSARANYGTKYNVTGIAEKAANEYDALRKSPKGTLFVIKGNRNSTAELFALKQILPNGKVEGTNPFTGGSVRLDANFTYLLVSSIK